MGLLPSLPTELVCQILGYLEPITALRDYKVPEEQRWDIRHWGRAIAAVARTCRALHAVATPLLYGRYEAAFHDPVLPFIDRSTVEHPRHQSVRYVATRTNGDTNYDYKPSPERLLQYRIWAQGSELDSYVLSETQTLTSGDAGNIELWRLISQAPNLESLSVTAPKWSADNVCSPDQPPVWISPIVSAAQSVQTDPKYSGWFQKLHTLSFSMHRQCGTWLVELLSLPCLKSLSLGDWGIEPYADWEVSLVWPEPTATSGVRDLTIWNVSVPTDVIVRIVDYCIALKSFNCDRAYDTRAGADVRGREWCVEILAGLQRHRQTLTSLSLHPSDKNGSWHLQQEYACIQGFQTLVALEFLNVPWHVIMGSPVGVKNAQDCWESVGDWRYPSLRDVLPKKLRHLKIIKTEFGTPDCKGIEQALCSALPFLDAGNDVLSLNSVEFVYTSAHYYKPLPMNFWHIQNTFRKAGRKFDYKIRLDPGDYSKPSQSSFLFLLISSSVGQQL